jgi:2,4-diketo-3-deoxy-L-fuconate hydrolase
MKLVRFGESGAERPGILDAEGAIRDLSGIIPDLAGVHLAPESLAKLAQIDTASLPRAPAGARLGPCVAGTRNFIAIGLNYMEHIRETNAQVPPEPIIFQKAPTAICGPYDDVMMPREARKLDWEVELCIVIGSRARYLDREKAMDVVAGYTICNDVSERYFQLERGEQWAKGKGCETFGPIGPWLVTRDEIADVQALDLELRVNDRVRQSDNTRTMIFPVDYLVWYVSQFFVLEPGDLITTGTPPGVGLGLHPPEFLSVGDEMHLTVAGLGEQRQRVVPFKL